MKKTVLLITFITVLINGQSHARNIQQIVGQYQDNQSSLIIFEDSTFMILAYATLLTGTVEIEKSEAKFILSNNNNFSVYGRRNNEIKNGSKLMFYGFNNGESYFGNTAEDKLRPIQTDLDSYYSFLNVSESKMFCFMGNKANWWDETNSRTLYKFTNKEEYNDFIILRKESPNASSFKAQIADEGKKLILLDDENKKTLEKGPIESEIKDQFIQKLLFKQLIGNDKYQDLMQRKYVFANSAYRQYEPQNILDTDLYISLNDGQGTYISREVYNENEKYDTGDPNEYHNYLRIYKYTRVEAEISEQLDITLDTIPISITSAVNRQEDLVTDDEELNSESEMTREEKIALEIKKLKTKIELLQTENKDENRKEIANHEYQIGNYFYALGNHEEGFRWYLRADQNGSISGSWSLAYCYLKGSGVGADSTLYFKSTMKVAEQNIGPACTEIGDCYAKGIGVNKDLEEAIRWYQRGQENGDKASRYKLGLAYQNGTGVAKDIDKAFQQFIKSNMNDYNVCNTLGKCYVEGLGTPKNLSIAAYFFRCMVRSMEANGNETTENLKMKEEVEESLNGILKGY